MAPKISTLDRLERGQKRGVAVIKRKVTEMTSCKIIECVKVKKKKKKKREGGRRRKAGREGRRLFDKDETGIA